MRRLFAAAWPLLLICGLVAAHLWLYLEYTADDAFISFRYARNFALGNGLVFNIGERVEGYSTFSWVVLLGLLRRAGLDIPTTAKLLNLALTLAAALLTALIERRWRGGWPWAALLLASDAAFGYWGANGMEVPLTMLLLLAGGTLHLEELARRRPPISALLFAGLALTRPEGVFFFGLTALHRLLAGGEGPRLLGWRAWLGRAARREWLWTALFLVVFVPFLLWRYSYYGAWVPNTVTVKASGLRLRALLEGGLTTYQFVAPRSAGLALIAAGLLATPSWWRRPLVAYAALLIAGNALFVTLAGGDWMPLDRFWVLVLPWWYLLLVFAAEQLVHAAGIAARGRVRPIAPLLLAGLVALGLAGSLVTRLTTNQPAINNAGPAASRWLRQVARPGDLVASSNIGAISYYQPDLRILDLVGLTDAHIAHTPARFPGGLLGRGDGYGHWDSAYVLGRQPRFIEIAGIDRAAAEVWGGRAAWAGADDLYRNPEFRRLYRYADMSYFVRVDDPIER